MKSAIINSFPPLKQVTVVNADVNTREPQDVEWAMETRFRPDADIILIPEARDHELNPVTDEGLVCKVGFDATAPHPRPEKFKRILVREVDLKDYDIEQSQDEILEFSTGWILWRWIPKLNKE